MNSPFPQYVVVPLHQLSLQANQTGAADARGEIPAPDSQFDPYKMHAEFGAKWSAFVRANFHNLRQVSLSFGVSERTARAWWKGETGANAAQVAIAFRHCPEATLALLQAA